MSLRGRVRARRLLASLRTDGWAVVDLLDAQQVARCRAEVDRLEVAPDHGFFVTVADAHGPVARAFDQALRPVVAPSVARVLPGFAPFLVAATTKGVGSDRPIKFHQDWTYTDERVTPTYFAWCPLVDVDATNGGLRVVPGSHRWATGLRASRTLEATEHLQEEFAARSVPVPLRAGQALLFHPATLHGSGPNPTGAPRPAVTVASAPVGAEFVHFHLDEDGSVRGWRVDDSFFTMNPYGAAPDGLPDLAPWDAVVTPDDFVATMGTGPATAGGPT